MTISKVPKNFFRRKLSNGACFVGEVRDSPSVALSVLIPYGAAHENEYQKGAAHLLEHILFRGENGSKSSRIQDKIEQLGGHMNAETEHFSTKVYCRLPKKDVLEGVELLSELVRKPKLTKEVFEREKAVVFREFGQYHDSPEEYSADKMHEVLFTPPFGTRVLGIREHVSKISKEDLSKIWDYAYAPSNFLLCAVGDFNSERILRVLETNFRRSESSPQQNGVVINQRNASHVERRRSLEQAHFRFGIHVPTPQNRLHHAFEILDDFLIGGVTSLLFRTIREERGLSYSLNGEIVNEKAFSYYTIYLSSLPRKVETCKNLIVSGFERATNISRREFELAKKRYIGRLITEEYDSEEMAAELTWWESSGMGAESFYQRTRMAEKVTIDEFREAGQLEGYSTVSILPN